MYLPCLKIAIWALYAFASGAAFGNPTCVQVAQPSPIAASCSKILLGLLHVPDARLEIKWSLQAGPGQLPRLLVQEKGCKLWLSESREISNGETFRVIDYRRQIFNVYDLCVLNGYQRGGYIPIGLTSQVLAWMMPDNFPENSQIIDTSGRGAKTLDQTITSSYSRVPPLKVGTGQGTHCVDKVARTFDSQQAQ